MGKILGIFAGIAVLAFVVWKYDSSQTEKEVVAAEAAMKSDIENNLTKGASVEQVDNLLAAHGITGQTKLPFHMQVEGMDTGSAAEVATQGPFGGSMHRCTINWAFFYDDSDRFLNYKDDVWCKNEITAGSRDPGEPMRPGVDRPAPAQPH